MHCRQGLVPPCRQMTNCQIPDMPLAQWQSSLASIQCFHYPPHSHTRLRPYFGLEDGRAVALKLAEEATSSRSKSAALGSRHRRPLRDRPPTLQAFQSVLSRTPSVSTQRLSRLPFVPPSPRSSIPESADMIPYQRVIRQSARSRISDTVT